MNKLKIWWKNLFLPKCDYCDQKVPVVWEAFNLPIQGEYKGNNICEKCIDKLPQNQMIRL